MGAEHFAQHLAIRDRVQRNCHISDARHARDYTLCIYLLKMRELFRWEQRLPYTAVLPTSELGEWIVVREKLWESLETSPFEPLLINLRTLEPFDNEAINQQLRGTGLVYSGGLGGFAKPHFFIGELEQEKHRDGVHLFVAGEEYARDITAPPAAALGDTIIIRRHSLRRMLWEKIEEWRWNARGEAMSRAMACYPFDHDSEGPHSMP